MMTMMVVIRTVGLCYDDGSGRCGDDDDDGGGHEWWCDGDYADGVLVMMMVAMFVMSVVMVVAL